MRTSPASIRKAQVVDASPDAERDRRLAMVHEQLSARGIRDRRVLRAMERMPRHAFVSDELREAAYGDRALPIGYEQTISQPYLVALMLQALELEGRERVLEIGTGGGYQAALLGMLAGEVHSLEIVPELAVVARQRLQALGIDNVRVVQGDGRFGLPGAAPFDAIVVSAGAAEVPNPLIDQLAEGGRLVIPVGDRSGQLLMRLRAHCCSLDSETLTSCEFVPLVGASAVDTPVPWAGSVRHPR